MFDNIHPVRQNLTQLISTLGENLTGVEVGVNRGEFSHWLLQELSISTLYSVDIWREYKAHDANSRDDFMASVVMRDAAERLAQFEDRSVMIRASSVKAASILSNMKFDFVYIDAGHEYEQVLEDLQAWFPLMKNGGIICGDDFVDGEYWHEGGEQSTHFGVRRAVLDFFKGRHEVDSNPLPRDGAYLPQWWVKLP